MIAITLSNGTLIERLTNGESASCLQVTAHRLAQISKMRANRWQSRLGSHQMGTVGYQIYSAHRYRYTHATQDVAVAKHGRTSRRDWSWCVGSFAKQLRIF